MKVFDRSAPTDRDERFVRVASLDELQAKRMIVVKGERCPILVVCHDDRVHALDNRCPHLGFPLHRGSVADGILTCHWHHARFDLVSGGTFDPWADDVPTADVEVRDGEVWVATRTRYADGDAHWRNRLRQGMEHNIGLVIAKAVFGLVGEGVDPRSLVRDAVIFGTQHRDGWGAGLTVLTALGNLLPFLPNDDLCLALFKGIRRVASDCDGAVPPRPRQPLTGDERAPSTLERWLRDWVLVRHRDGAERTLLTAITAGASAVQMAELMLVASTERGFADGGHLLDFVNKAFEALDLIGWDHAAAVLPAVAGELVQARGAEESDAWRHPIDLVSLLRAAYRRNCRRCWPKERRSGGAGGTTPAWRSSFWASIRATSWARSSPPFEPAPRRPISPAPWPMPRRCGSRASAPPTSTRTGTPSTTCSPTATLFTGC